MPDSGVKCAEEVNEEFQKLSIKHQYRYIIFKLNDEGTEIVIEKIGGAEKTFEDLKNDLPKDKCRYAVFDLNFESKEKQKREKVIFLYHSPDNHATIGDKVCYSSSKKAIEDKLGRGALHKVFHFGDHSEINLKDIEETMKKDFK